MEIELSVIILCYRIGERAHALVDKVISVLDGMAIPWEIVLVGNYVEGSSDTTPDAVKKIAAGKVNIKAVALPKKGMMGWDARSGLDLARGKYLCLIDGDGQMPFEDIARVYKKIKAEGLDLVQTYRRKRHDGFARTLNSSVYNLIFRILFPGTKVRDINSKPKIFTRKAYDAMRLVSDDWFLDAEMAIRARMLGLKMGELPTEFYRCGYRKSFVAVSSILEFVRNMLRARIEELRGPERR